MPTRKNSLNSAWKFIVLVGVVSLFSDMTYEGARSISGPFLGMLQASAVVVGVVAGLGEFIGYGLRLVSGYLTDRVGKYWPTSFVGYAFNLLAVPLLALAWRWEVAACLLVTERLGRAIRTPARDAMLSHAVTQVGRGWGFGFHEAMDQVGAVLGPILVAGIIYFKGGYREGFAVLLIPALLALAVLSVCARLYPEPQHLEETRPHLAAGGFRHPYWLYMVAAGLLAAGYADFPLIAYHLSKTGIAAPGWIPLLYALAMGVDAVAALALGRIFDRLGPGILAAVPFLSVFFAPLVFLGGFHWALAGMVLWGIGMGAQESIIKAPLVEMIPKERRATGYGLFYAGFGLFWLLGSTLMGFLYEISLVYLVAFSMLTQLGAVPLLLWLGRSPERGEG